MKTKKLWKTSLLVAGVFSSGMALYHFILPYHLGWKDSIIEVTAMINWAIFSLNHFFSFLLLWGGIITIITAFRWEKVDLLGYGILVGMGLFWIFNASYQIFIPMPLPERLIVLKWGLLTFSVFLVILYILAVSLRFSEAIKKKQVKDEQSFVKSD